jgi:hypothetical protein
MNEKAIDRVNEGQSNFELVQRQAKAYAASSLVPDRFRDNIPNVMIAMELSERIGISVFSVMKNIYFVGNSPSFMATFMIATVNGCGRFTPLRYRFQGKKGDDDWGCRAYAMDKESGDECVGPLVDWAMVKAEKWDKNPKWKSMTELMFHYRSAAFWSRVYAPELSMGMHTRDEVEDARIIDVTPAAIVTESPVEARKAEVAERPVEVPEDLDVFDELEFALSETMTIQEKASWIKEQCDKAGWKNKQLTEHQAAALLDVLNNPKGEQNGNSANQ